jgi:quercetin dioxygenase-like cupin family protein
MHGHGSETPTSDRRTHGSEQRSQRDLSVPLRTFDVADVAGRLREEPAFRTDGRNAETVHDDGTVRVMVGVIDTGRDIGALQSDGFMTISFSEGRGTLRRGEEELEVVAGTAAILAPGAAWAFEATEPSILMATFWDFGEEGGSYPAPVAI